MGRRVCACVCVCMRVGARACPRMRMVCTRPCIMRLYVRARVLVIFINGLNDIVSIFLLYRKERLKVMTVTKRYVVREV